MTGGQITSLEIFASASPGTLDTGIKVPLDNPTEVDIRRAILDAGSTLITELKNRGLL